MSDDTHVDWVNAVADAIRKADGNHTMGAAALAEVVVDALYPLVQAREMEFWAAELQKMARQVEKAREREMASVIDRAEFEDSIRVSIAYGVERRALRYPEYGPERRALTGIAEWVRSGEKSS